MRTGALPAPGREKKPNKKWKPNLQPRQHRTGKIFWEKLTSAHPASSQRSEGAGGFGARSTPPQMKQALYSCPPLNPGLPTGIWGRVSPPHGFQPSRKKRTTVQKPFGNSTWWPLWPPEQHKAGGDFLSPRRVQARPHHNPPGAPLGLGGTNQPS